MKPFDYFLKTELVRKIRVDVNRAKALLKDAKSRIRDLKQIDKSKVPKLFFEYTYDALRDFCDSILFLDGYKSYSHEASISYLFKKGFDVSVIEQFNLFRYKRNALRYYGEKISVKDAQDIFNFYLKIKNKLNSILRELK